ncbi:cyclic nucleotide-gated ion channel 1-like isoform X1 [Rosa rugosa]|uniref:cyclic nucleotide-gated ion channel 1-like isoform X1 n=1 Tax=Rosa rugosa TaxID=74645 RepID=UPI002B413BB1|nr:cyclic nucleotide-gated ion channel 1-like isoform X1 [Rosa rugosa]XP_061998577.1 cyclic nucleotide-gated ion channel 1-like isoform X1 [Rosa rugosa]
MSEQAVVDIWHSEAVKRKAQREGHRSRKIWPKLKDILRSFLLSWWKTIFTISCMLSVSVDPLFLYIPVTNEDMKCLRLDHNLKTVTLLLRSAVDLPCIVNIISQILAVRPRQRRRVKLVEMAKRILWPYFLVDISAVLPIPHVVILILLTRTRKVSNPNARKLLNSLILFQYFPRIFRMYQSCKVNKEEPDEEEADKTRYGDHGHRIWFKVYKFILASHVLGAFWYFFSIQRAMDCWQYACRKEKKCGDNTFDCGGNHSFKNVTFINDFCPISTPNPTLFNFGIFMEALQSNIVGSTDFPQKFLHCFWWSLQSLSSFGQNLETSTYAWENLFAVGISVIGMILFLIYLNAVLQFVTTTSERHKREMMSKEVDLWLFRKGLPSNLKQVIMHFMIQKLKQKIDVGVDDILSILPSTHRKYIERFLRLAILKKVPMLQTMDVKMLKEICEHLQPVHYPEDICIIGQGERLYKMIFITNGTVQTYKTNGEGGRIGSKFLEKGDFYGSKELLNWASKFSSFDDLPISTRMVKPIMKVEAFVLSAEDLKNVVRKFWWHFTKDKDLTEFSEPVLEELALSTIKQIRRKAKKKQAIRSLNNQLAMGRPSMKLQRVVSRAMWDQLPSPVQSPAHSV